MKDSKEVLHTQGELWRDDNGFIAIGTGDNYKTFADLDCSDLDIAEREANKERMILVWNNYQTLLDSNRELLEALEEMANMVGHWQQWAAHTKYIKKEYLPKITERAVAKLLVAKTAINNAKNIK